MFQLCQKPLNNSTKKCQIGTSSGREGGTIDRAYQQAGGVRGGVVLVATKWPMQERSRISMLHAEYFSTADSCILCMPPGER